MHLLDSFEELWELVGVSSGYLHIKTPSWIMFIYVYIFRKFVVFIVSLEDYGNLRRSCYLHIEPPS